MTRQAYLEKQIRQIYGDFPTDDAAIDYDLANTWLIEGTAIAAKQNYKDNVAIDGIGYVNGSFFTRFTDIALSSNGNFEWRMQLPEIPLGIGRNEGISTLQLVDENGRVTNPFIPISEQQRTYYQSMRPIPNKVLYYYQGSNLYCISTLLLNLYTANVTMVSGGDASDLDSELNVPPDYLPIIDQFLFQQLTMQRAVRQDTQNEGLDTLATV
jgi:hypothetical protein